MRRILLVCSILLLVSVQSVRPEVELVLTDGRVLAGVDVKREEQVYVLELETGERMTLPVELVAEVRLIGEDERKRKEKEDEEFLEMHPGVRKTEVQPLAGTVIDENAPTEIRHTEAQTLAGHRVDPPTPREQTAALGEPSRFQKGVVNPDWKPKTDWNMNQQEQNNFAPSKWSKGVVDSDWTPESAYDKNNDVMAASQSSFSEGVIDNSWEPTDAFKNQGWGSN